LRARTTPPIEAAFVVEEATVAVTFAHLEQDITDCLAKLRLARELELPEQVKIHERRLDYLLAQVPRRGA
jgi:hypothetical protein